MNDRRNRYLLTGLVLAAACLLLYIVGFFYDDFVNSPADLASLIFIIALYAGAIYYHLHWTGEQN